MRKGGERAGIPQQKLHSIRRAAVYSPTVNISLLAVQVSMAFLRYWKVFRDLLWICVDGLDECCRVLLSFPAGTRSGPGA